VLKQTFIELTQKYSDDNRLIEILWNEIEKNYTDKNRYYHTLAHLDNLYEQLLEVKDEIEDWDTILFTLYYHDIIYNSTKKDNEYKSAELAKVRLESIAYPADKISKCVIQILSTKEHSKSIDNDANLFTDADLSILGQAWEAYSDYFKQVRKEYSIYPDFLYNRGRKKVLNQFLKMGNIFKTNLFYSKFENVARQNLANELKQF
jgi:predicted metal-dependent HD superfamily phosphohydrolase